MCPLHTACVGRNKNDLVEHSSTEAFFSGLFMQLSLAVSPLKTPSTCEKHSTLKESVLLVLYFLSVDV